MGVYFNFPFSHSLASSPESVGFFANGLKSLGLNFFLLEWQFATSAQRSENGS